jgi:hypothetical protein
LYTKHGWDYSCAGNYRTSKFKFEISLRFLRSLLYLQGGVYGGYGGGHGSVAYGYSRDVGPYGVVNNGYGMGSGGYGIGAYGMGSYGMGTYGMGLYGIGGYGASMGAYSVAPMSGLSVSNGTSGYSGRNGGGRGDGRQARYQPY